MEDGGRRSYCLSRSVYFWMNLQQLCRHICKIKINERAPLRILYSSSFASVSCLKGHQHACSLTVIFSAVFPHGLTWTFYEGARKCPEQLTSKIAFSPNSLWKISGTCPDICACVFPPFSLCSSSCRGNSNVWSFLKNPSSNHLPSRDFTLSPLQHKWNVRTLWDCEGTN